MSLGSSSSVTAFARFESSMSVHKGLVVKFIESLSVTEAGFITSGSMSTAQTSHVGNEFFSLRICISGRLKEWSKLGTSFE